MLEVMRNDYIRTAYSKGLRERAVVWRHALKNAMIPVVTIIGLRIGGLIGGTVLVESVFGAERHGQLPRRVDHHPRPRRSCRRLS